MKFQFELSENDIVTILDTIRDWTGILFPREALQELLQSNPYLLAETIVALGDTVWREMLLDAITKDLTEHEHWPTYGEDPSLDEGVAFVTDLLKGAKAKGYEIVKDGE